MHDFGGGGDSFGVGRQGFDNTVDGGLGTSVKVHGLQPVTMFFTPSKWIAWAMMVSCGLITCHFVF
jgi:hypothetical protein